MSTKYPAGTATHQQYKFYAPMQNGEGEEVRIEVLYLLGGVNYFSGKQEPRGVYVSFARVKRDFGPTFASEAFSPFSKGSFKVFARPLNRKSQKTMNEVAGYVEGILPKLASYYILGHHDKVAHLIDQLRGEDA